MSVKKKCPVCEHSKILEKFFGTSTVAGYICHTKKESLNQPIFDVKINLCLNCNALFQSHSRGQSKILKKMYKNHQVIFRNSKFYKKYYKELTKIIKNSLSTHKQNKIIEIGANDGSLLKTISSRIKARFFSVESSKFVKKFYSKKITLVNNFFNFQLTKMIKKKYGTMDYIIIRHLLEHIKYPRSFFNSLKIISNSETKLLIEVPYSVSIFKFKRFENISYSHLIHYNVRSMIVLANASGFLIYDYKIVETDGGSIVFFLKKSQQKTCFDIIPKIESKKNFLLMFNNFYKSFLYSLINFDNFIKNKVKNKIVGFGAGAKGQFLIHMYKMNRYLQYVIDETKFFKNKFIPGTDIQVISMNKFLKLKKSLIINLAPTHYLFIKNKIGNKHKFYDLINN